MHSFIHDMTYMDTYTHASCTFVCMLATHTHTIQHNHASSLLHSEGERARAHAGKAEKGQGGRMTALMRKCKSQSEHARTHACSPRVTSLILEPVEDFHVDGNVLPAPQPQRMRAPRALLAMSPRAPATTRHSTMGTRTRASRCYTPVAHTARSHSWGLQALGSAPISTQPACSIAHALAVRRSPQQRNPSVARRLVPPHAALCRVVRPVLQQGAGRGRAGATR